MTSQQLQESVEQQELSQQIAALESKINSLQSHLDSLQNKPSTADLDVESATLEEIIRHSQEAAKTQQEALARQNEAEAIQHSIKVFRSQLVEKRDALQISKISSEFERLRHKAIEFNNLIDEAVARLDKMKKIGEEIAFKDYNFLTISAEPKEMPYASIHDAIVRVCRRVDVKRTS